jgi:hypothetical protein
MMVQTELNFEIKDRSIEQVRDELAVKLSSAELAELQDRAALWLAAHHSE